MSKWFFLVLSMIFVLARSLLFLEILFFDINGYVEEYNVFAGILLYLGYLLPLVFFLVWSCLPKPWLWRFPFVLFFVQGAGVSDIVFKIPSQGNEPHSLVEEVIEPIDRVSDHKAVLLKCRV